ncbi:MAG: DNA-3-methyladenine glycosylase 2 family protein [Lachnospiraceae bacterium]|nr:DNA-3-methyladenine glycosylase 2 family protein [Lachnospiraceae bacterium]
MKIEFHDDFDLKKIKDSGQCFRVRELSDGSFRFIHKNKVLYIRNTGGASYEVSADKEEWEDIWLPYFDAGRSYEGIRLRIEPEDRFLKQASEFGKGIRILRQDPWEMLITFIISQRKNIPAISGSVEMIAERFGKKVKPDVCPAAGGEQAEEEPFFPDKEEGQLYLFPTPSELSRATEDDLRLCKLGYRAPYVLDAIRRVNNGELDLCKLNSCNDTELFETLKSVQGVGDKVSNCVCLYAYGRTSSVPIDTWIARIIELEYNGKNPFDKYEDAGGIMQQWAFFYAREKDLGR